MQKASGLSTHMWPRDSKHQNASNRQHHEHQHHQPHTYIRTIVSKGPYTTRMGLSVRALQAHSNSKQQGWQQCAMSDAEQQLLRLIIKRASQLVRVSHCCQHAFQPNHNCAQSGRLGHECAFPFCHLSPTTVNSRLDCHLLAVLSTHSLLDEFAQLLGQV